MAYRSTKRRSPVRRRYPARKYGGRTTRRSYAKKRTYRKKASSKMSNKRILNLTSIKKRDTMLSAYQLGSTVNPQPGAYPVQGTGGGNGGNTTVLLWCATARDNTVISGGGSGNRFTPATRTATTCFMRGLAENVELSTNTGVAWQWRRICFTFKDPGALSQTQTYFLETSSGFQRNNYNVTSGSSPDSTNLENLRQLVFRGQLGTDWSSYLTAPVDNSRCTIKYDKTTNVNSGNANGKLVNRKLWMPMNSNLVYDDDELGGAEAARPYSIGGKQGMGDYYVMDIFQAGVGATSSDLLSFLPQATLYWHEK
ncbi:capsid protein [Alces alces faeces associated genomovirus MP84]|uniref:Capsid protein n=1 Tax=Alces alces faeces associated genomovirus MP84 TaxID=2219116 RepID=A0A2Z5CIC6_9VIRU|nr:capsid protein [Alces alces faeces associated genomovirus MP84]AXB22623.1 capsid protein [Alces alces faeces associated genomovirus MP84]AXB22627.1 capsid protein [Alces alces faeces associated genomovirus MP146]